MVGEIMISAKYFDGLKAQIQEVKLTISNQHIIVSGNDVDKNYAIGNYKIAEVFSGAPCYISFFDERIVKLVAKKKRKNFFHYLTIKRLG